MYLRQRYKDIIISISNNSLLKSSMVYTFSTLFINSVPLILLGYLTKKYSLADFGIISIFSLVQSFLMPFISLNMNVGITREYYKKSEDNNYLISQFFSTILLSISICIILGSLIFFLNPFNILPFRYQFLAILTTISQFIFNLMLLYLQLNQKIIKYFLISCLLVFSNIFITFYFVSNNLKIINGRVLGITLSYTIFSLLGFLIIVIKNLKLNKSFPKIIKDNINVLKIGIPIIPHTIAGILIGLSDRYFLAKNFGLSEVGYYSAMYQFGGVLMLVFSSLNLAYMPYIYKILNIEVEFSQVIKKNIYSSIFFILISSIVFYFFSQFFYLKLVNKNYYPGLKYLPWMVLTAFINGIYMIFANIVFYSKHSKFMSLITFSAAIIYVITCPFMINMLGSIGVVITSFITSSLILVATSTLALNLLRTNKFKI